MTNLKIEVVTPEKISDITQKLKKFMGQEVVLTIARNDTIEKIVDFLEDDGEIMHLPHTTPTEQITDVAIIDDTLSFMFDTTKHSIALAGIQIHFEKKEMVVQLPNSTDVYIFETVPPREYFEERIDTSDQYDN